MQEYVEERTIAISVKAAKLSGKVLAAACKKAFAEIAMIGILMASLLFISLIVLAASSPFILGIIISI